MYDYSNGYDDVIDEDKICATNHCDGCPLFQKCYDTSNEVEDDYDTLTPDEFVDKYVK